MRAKKVWKSAGGAEAQVEQCRSPDSREWVRGNAAGPLQSSQSLRRLSDLEYIFGLHLVFRTLEGVNLPRNTQRVIVGREINT